MTDIWPIVEVTEFNYWIVQINEYYQHIYFWTNLKFILVHFDEI